jgi:hypothetical protein
MGVLIRRGRHNGKVPGRSAAGISVVLTADFATGLTGFTTEFGPDQFLVAESTHA